MKKLFYTSALAVLLWQPTLAGAETLDKQAALQRALQNNPTYKAALATIDAADGATLQASLPPNPDAVFEIENFAGENENEGFDGAELTLGVEQKIELGGKRSNRTKVAGFSYSITQQQAKAQALSLLAETDYAYMRVAVAQERVVLADKRLALADKTHDIVKQRVSTARSPEIEHTKADIEKAAAEVEQRRAEQELATALNDLARLLGGIDTADMTVEADIESLPDLLDKEQLLQAIQNAPQMKAQEFAKMQARSSLDLARSQAVPDPTFGLAVRRFNENDSTALVAGVSFPLPVFNRNQGGIKEAKANMIKTDAETYAAGLALRQSAIQTWENYAASLAEAKRYQNEIIPSAQKAYNQADDGYDRGAFGFLDLLDAQRTLYKVQEARLDSLLSVYEAKAQTDFLMGTHSPMIEQLSQATLEGQTNE